MSEDFERDAEGSLHESVIVETRSPPSIIAEEVPTLKMVNSNLLPHIREQMSGPDLHVFTLKFLALKKPGFSPIKNTL